MTEEIKKILKYLKTKENTRRIKCITTEETNLLLNYITNLQKENMKLISENEAIKNIKYTVDETIYKQRNEKAIEYIENHTENIDRGRYYEDYVETYDLLNILQGGDE